MNQEAGALAAMKMLANREHLAPVISQNKKRACRGART